MIVSPVQWAQIFRSAVRQNTHSLCPSYQTREGFFPSDLKWVSVHQKCGHVWSVGYPTSAAVGLGLPLAHQPNIWNTGHLRGHWTSRGKFQPLYWMKLLCLVEKINLALWVLVTCLFVKEWIMIFTITWISFNTIILLLFLILHIIFFFIS